MKTLLWCVLLAAPLAAQRDFLAANEIDQRLQRDAPHLGESRGGARRVFFEPPLGVTYEVDQARQIVFVLYVWRFRPGRRQP